MTQEAEEAAGHGQPHQAHAHHGEVGLGEGEEVLLASSESEQEIHGAGSSLEGGDTLCRCSIDCILYQTVDSNRLAGFKGSLWHTHTHTHSLKLYVTKFLLTHSLNIPPSKLFNLIL